MFGVRVSEEGTGDVPKAFVSWRDPLEDAAEVTKAIVAEAIVEDGIGGATPGGHLP